MCSVAVLGVQVDIEGSTGLHSAFLYYFVALLDKNVNQPNSISQYIALYSLDDSFCNQIRGGGNGVHGVDVAKSEMHPTFFFFCFFPFSSVSFFVGFFFLVSFVIRKNQLISIACGMRHGEKKVGQLPSNWRELLTCKHVRRSIQQQQNN